MSSSITLDGNLADWTAVDRLDIGIANPAGFKIYGRVVDGMYHFAIESTEITLGAQTTIWLNTDQNSQTGFKIFGFALGAEYKIEFLADPTAPLGVRPALYSTSADGSATLVEDGLSFAFTADGKIVELAIDKTKIAATPSMSAVIDINESVYLPTYYGTGEFVVEDKAPAVRTEPNLKVGIVFSATSADHYFNETAYSQLIMAAQSQAAAAGIPFDILTEADLTDLSTVINYDALIFPSFGFVDSAKVSAIENVLMDAVYKYGISLVAAGNFMTNDETGAALAGNAYARMEAPARREADLGGASVDQVTVTGNGDAAPAIIGYGDGDAIRTYVKNATSQVGTSYFKGVNDADTQVVAEQTDSTGTHNAVLATQTGSNNVFFATEGMLADSNMLQHAISWAARPLDSPVLKLQMGRQTSIFAARNDMDQSQEAQDVSGNDNGGEASTTSFCPSLRSGKRISISSAHTTSISGITPKTGSPPTGRYQSRIISNCSRWAMRSALTPTLIPTTRTR